MANETGEEHTRVKVHKTVPKVITIIIRRLNGNTKETTKEH